MRPCPEPARRACRQVSICVSRALQGLATLPTAQGYLGDAARATARAASKPQCSFEHLRNDPQPRASYLLQRALVREKPEEKKIAAVDAASTDGPRETAAAS